MLPVGISDNRIDAPNFDHLSKIPFGGRLKREEIGKQRLGGTHHPPGARPPSLENPQSIELLQPDADGGPRNLVKTAQF